MARKFVVGNGLNYGGYDNVPLPLDRTAHIMLGLVSQVGNMTKKRYSVDKLNEQYETRQLFVIDNHMGNFICVKTKLIFEFSRKLMNILFDGCFVDDGNGLETALLIGCSLLGVLLVLSIIGYLYLRFKMDPQLQRLPSDHHELTLQGPILEMVSEFGAPYDSNSV